MRKLIYKEWSYRTLFQTYCIYENEITVQTLFIGKIVIPIKDIEKITISNPLVIWDALRKGELDKNTLFGLKILKNDLADLFIHVVIYKNTGFFKQVHITPANPKQFKNIIEGLRK